MGRPGTFAGPTVVLGPTGGRLVKPDEIVDEVVNGFPTEEGGYRSVYSPSTYLPAAGGGIPASGATATHSPLQYGPVYGIHHAMLEGGQRDVLLLHTADQLWEFRPWDRAWYPLIGVAATSGTIHVRWAYVEQKAEKWPTQFVTTPIGVVIVPQGQAAHFYDGEVVAQLGFTAPPAPPSGLGPESRIGYHDETDIGGGVNDGGYTHHGLWARLGSTDEHLGLQRIGTLSASDTVPTSAAGRELTAGYLKPGRWRAKVALVDRWGNVSPLSGESNDIQFDLQPSTIFVAGAPNTAAWVGVERARHEIAWDGVAPGPDHTMARVIYRTKDLENSGDASFYELPLNGLAVPNALGTLPDNISSFYPDNVPDAWLFVKPLEVDPVPVFRLAAIAFGRLWIGNALGDRGMIRPSEVGRWGTFPKNPGRIYPDPTGAEVTGLHAVRGGLLVFTASSTYLVTPNDTGDGFRSSTVSSTAGCVAPSSIVTMDNGMTVWLGREGFYGFDGQSAIPLFKEHRQQARRINWTRAGRSNATFDYHSQQYHCWVPHDGSQEPNRRYKFDGVHWHWDDYDGTVSMRAVTVTADHRRMAIGAGTIGSDTGVWAVNRGDSIEEMTVKTGWIRATRSADRGAVYRVQLWLREASNSNDNDANRIQVKVRRDYRAEVTHTVVVEPRPTVYDDYQGNVAEADEWPITVGTAVFRRRRPFWASRDIDVPHCEVFQLEISCPKKMEILGFRVIETPSDDGGAAAVRQRG